MYTAIISVGPIKGKRATIMDEFASLLAVYMKNGQIVGNEWPTYEKDGKIHATVSIPERNSLVKKYDNVYVKKYLTILQEMGCDFKYTIMGKDTGLAGPCRCKNRKSFILFTSYYSQKPCLMCGDCFKYVPLYHIPFLHDYEYGDILCWESDYQSCDKLQMHCEVGERFGEKQLYDVNSALSRKGRELCKKIQKKTGLKTYYFLMKGRGKSIQLEKERRCPDCGAKWLLKKPLHGMFDFQCKRCRLLSNISWDIRSNR